MSYTNKQVNLHLEICEGSVLSKNKGKVEKPSMAYDHLISTVITSIRGLIGYVLTTEPRCNGQVEFSKLVKDLREKFIDNIVQSNSYTATFKTPKFEGYDRKLSESRYYQFAKITFKKVATGEVPLVELNNDALLAYKLYELSNKVIYKAFEVKDNKLVVNEENEFVVDYKEYNAEVNNRYSGIVSEIKGEQKAVKIRVVADYIESTKQLQLFETELFETLNGMATTETDTPEEVSPEPLPGQISIDDIEFDEASDM